MYSYLLLLSMEYEGPWIRGIVSSLKEALEYFDEEVKQDDDSFYYEVEVWDGLQRICTLTPVA